MGKNKQEGVQTDSGFMDTNNPIVQMLGMENAKEFYSNDAVKMREEQYNSFRADRNDPRPMASRILFTQVYSLHNFG